MQNKREKMLQWIFFRFSRQKITYLFYPIKYDCRIDKLKVNKRNTFSILFSFWLSFEYELQIFT